MKQYFSVLILLLLLPAFRTSAQELNCSVRVNAQKRQIVDPKVYETLQQSISEFMNNTKWTDDFFQSEERINCNILLTIQEEFSATSFKADLAIQASRPVFDSDYETAILNHIDKELSFEYEQFQPIIFSRNTYNDNLSAVLSFYAFLILGLDYDSFSLYGGEPYLQSAQEIINNVPSGAAAVYKGWRSVDGNRNRFWIMENLLSPRVRSFREAWYNYHRNGLDMAAGDFVVGRAVIVESLDQIMEVNQNYPNSMIVQMFNNSKGKEILDIFRQGTREEKQKVIQIMSRIDAPNAAEYRSMR